MLGEMSDRKINTVWYHLNVESQKVDQNSNVTKRSRFTDIDYKLSVTSGDRDEGRGKIG